VDRDDARVPAAAFFGIENRGFDPVDDLVVAVDPPSALQDADDPSFRAADGRRRYKDEDVPGRGFSEPGAFPAEGIQGEKPRRGEPLSLEDPGEKRIPVPESAGRNSRIGESDPSSVGGRER